LGNGAAVPEAAATVGLGEDAESGLKSRVAMLREKLLQKRQEHDSTSPGQALSGEETRKDSTNLVDTFLAEDSNRHALQTLAEDLARKRGEVGKGDKLGLPPAVDIPKAELGDELLQDFMSRSRVGLGGKESERDTNGIDEQAQGAVVEPEMSKEKKAKKKKKKDKDKSRKAKVKCNLSEESNVSKKAAEKAKVAKEPKQLKQRKDTRKGHKKKKDSSSGKSSEPAFGAGKERRKKEPKVEECQARERHADEHAKQKENKGDRAERGRERRERSPRCSKRQEHSRHHSHPRRQARSRSRRRGRAKRSSASSSSVGRSCSSRSGCGKDQSRAASPQEFKVYGRVMLHGLQVNTDLNGLCGVVAPPGLPRTGEMAGTYKVRLENAREVAVKPANLQLARCELSPSRERRLRMVLDRMRSVS